MVVVYLFSHFFWFFGINGGSVVEPYLIHLQTLSAENLSAYRAGEELPNIINQQFRFIALLEEQDQHFHYSLQCSFS